MAIKKKVKKQADLARQAKLTIQRRTLCLLLVFGVASFLALFVKVYDLTINQNEEMKERAAKQQTRSTTISASRGTIYDRTGKTLASSATADNIFLDPMAIQARAEELDEARAKKMADGLKEGETLPITGEEYKELIATTLEEILGVDAEDIREMMKKTWSQYEVVKSKVERDIGDQVRAFITDNITKSNIQGIHLQSDAKRYYAYSNLASHVIGFLGSENHGAYGLEAVYDSTLEGSNGLVVTAKDAWNRELMFQYEQYYDAEDGHSLQLTIDSTIQYYVERGLEDMVSRYGAAKGAMGIVMDVNSGALLALASSPSYDLNSPRAIYDTHLQNELKEAMPKNADGSVKEVEDLTEEERAVYNKKLGELQLRQWRNKAVNDTYEPGSTFKILTLSMALEEGTVTPNSTFECSGSIRVGGWDKPMYCSNHAGHGHQDLKTATANSCNPAFVNIGRSVGGQRFHDYMEAFGLTTPTGLDLNGETSGIIGSAETLMSADVNLASYSFGQTFNVTPIALIRAQAACINGGYLYTPYLVEKELDKDGNVISQHDATPVRQVISEETSATVREMLEYVVSDGTGRNGQVAGYRVGGKTGTADKTGTGDVVVSFLSFAPANDPQVIMLLTLDTPSRDTGTYVSGGNMVAPTASSIMSDILPYLGIAPQYTEEDASAMDGTVPYLVGMTEEAAAARMEEYGFSSYRTIGDGEAVTDQIPAGGAIVPVGAELILYMGEEKPDSLCKVPNLMGMNADNANKALADAGLILKVSGASGSKGIKVIDQSHAAGTEVKAGTVITVRMGQSSITAD